MKSDDNVNNRVLERISKRSPEIYDEYSKILEREGHYDGWVSDQGYKCFINRNDFGAWCGYVTIPKGHALFGLYYMNDSNCNRRNCKKNGHGTPEAIVDVHGGITYSDGGDGDEPGWVFGFDTSHYDDFAPGLGSHISEDATYKNKIWVINETNNLAFRLYDLRKKARHWWFW